MRLVVLGMMLLAQVATGGPPMAKPNCRDRCGDIMIPYPFGMERRDCYMNKWFEIHCNRNKPFLPTLKLEVLNISFGTRGRDSYPFSTLTVKGPIISNGNCSGLNGSHRPVNLIGSPFYFFDSGFTAVGCNISALQSYRASSTINGCNTGCIQGQKFLHQDRPLQVFSNSSNSTACNDFNNCCQTPAYGKVFDPRFRPIDDNHSSGSGCSLAFVADLDWVSTQLYKQKELLYVPLSLSWTVFHNDIGFPNLSSTDCIRDFSAANETVISVDHCVCVGGYVGNPYLECQDFDECQNSQIHQCQGITKCVNTLGSFKCVNNPVWITVIIIAGIIFGSFAIVFGSWWTYRLFERRNKSKLRNKFFKRNGGLLLQQQITSMDGGLQKIKVFTSKELEEATDNFNKNRILGQGGQGTVYKGMLKDGIIVAVKKSTLIDEENLQEFINELVILTQINHRNVVKLLGCCLETEVPLLIYEFVPNGSLFHHIHDQNEDVALSWEMRLRIATEVAGAIAYLHSEASIPIYHRDIKSTNVLLDEKFRAKVSDFGISRSITIDQTHLTTNVQGTLGYLDPEYFQSGHFTAKSDVYSFGVVLLELLTGQKPICWRRSEERRSLATYFNHLMEDNKLFDIVDTVIMQPKHEQQIIAVADLARRCLNLHGRFRPDMKEVAIELEHIRSSSTQNIEEIVPLANASPSTVSCDHKDSTSLLSFEIEPVISFQTR